MGSQARWRTQGMGERFMIVRFEQWTTHKNTTQVMISVSQRSESKHVQAMLVLPT